MQILKKIKNSYKFYQFKKKANSVLTRANRSVFSLFGKDLNLRNKKVYGRKVWIRKNTPDLSVAISCFDGEFNILEGLFPKDYNGVIVDAGGYIGTAAMALSELYPKANIISIEPSKDNYRILKKNISKYPNITSIYGALVASDKKKVTLKNRKTGAWGYTIVNAPKDSLNVDIMGEVPCYKLSNLGVDIKDIGILKLDIEGGEYDIMKNDTESLQSIPVILVELHDRIIEGCSDLFFEFSKERVVTKDDGEKYLSVKRDYN